MRRPGLLFLLLLFFGFAPAPAQRRMPATKQLSPIYKKWIDEDVTYIISKDEREEFLRLSTDEERDSYIDAFWETRNPDPHSPINTFKEEHYSRLAYVRDNFSSDPKYDDGWRTDMGRVYITLGAPKQRARYHIGMNTREVEIWFYQATSPALPPYFNLVFYKRRAFDTYRLYSPRDDGPQRIVTDDMHSDSEALKTIRDSMGSEAAHAMVSLLPDEPVDVHDPHPSMLSDFLLEEVRDLPDQKLEKDRIARLKGMSKDSVTASIFNPSSEAKLETAIFRDELGRETADFLLHDGGIDPNLVGEFADKSSGYSMTLRAVLATADGRAVYQQQEKLEGKLQAAQVELAHKKQFSAEGRLPVVPGKYTLEVTLTNNRNLEAVRLRKDLEVPEIKPAGLGLSQILVYKSAIAVGNIEGAVPFTLTKLRFAPRALDTVSVHAGEQVPLVFQLWLPKLGAAMERPAKVHLHYLCESVAAAAGAKAPWEFDEDVETSNSDAAGNLVTGHAVPTADLGPGSYRVVLKASAEGIAAAAFSTLTLRVVPTDTTIEGWTAYGPVLSASESKDDLKRGMAAEALGHLAEADGLYASELKTDPADLQAFVRLAALYSAEGKVAELANLGNAALVGSAIPPSTLMSIAGAVRDSGDLKKAIRLVTAQLELQAPSAPMYELLASMYETSGDRGKANDLREQAKKFAATPAQK